MRRLEQAGIAALVLALVVVPTAVHGSLQLAAALLGSGLPLVWWRSHPRRVAVLGGASWLVAAYLGPGAWFPDTAMPIMALLATVAALGWSGRAAWLVAPAIAGCVVAVWLAIPGTSWVALVMFSVPGFLAGTVLRLRRETADQLAERGRELEEERELFAALALRHERARIAAELHDIVGHAISVMVIQAAAGQRLVDADPGRATQAFAAIAESARQGTDDLRRLVDLLGGTEIAGPDLSMIDEVVTRAARSGLAVMCRFEGDHSGVDASTAHIAFRIVQESLTNALRHAPGSTVRVLVSGSAAALTVCVENDPSAEPRPGLTGTGRGLTGLRERVEELGGRLTAGPAASGGWAVNAALPGLSRAREPVTSPPTFERAGETARAGTRRESRGPGARRS